MSRLVNNLIKKGYLQTDLLIDAFSEISRAEFVPGELELEAENDVALPIGYGQTISQPSVVAFMMELLDCRQGHKVLDVGSGSGWTTSLLAYIVGGKGKIIALERIKELKEFGERNVEKYSYIKKGIVSMVCSDGSKGCASEAPFDRILVSAVGTEVPEPLKNQLKTGGKMVLPIGSSVVYVEKKSDEEFYQENFPGFYFIPLIIER